MYLTHIQCVRLESIRNAVAPEDASCPKKEDLGGTRSTRGGRGYEDDLPVSDGAEVSRSLTVSPMTEGVGGLTNVA